MIQDFAQSHSSSSSSSSGESFEGAGATEDDDIQIFNLPPFVSHQSIVNEGDHRPHRQPRPTFYNTNPNRRPPFPPAFPFPANNNFNRPFYPQQPSFSEFPQPIYNTELDDDDNTNFSSGANNGEGPSEVVDLTNDIRVNQILNEQGRPFNPDAEFISVPNQPRPRPFESYPQQYPTYYFTAFRDIKK